MIVLRVVETQGRKVEQPKTMVSFKWSRDKVKYTTLLLPIRLLFRYKKNTMNLNFGNLKP